MSSNCDDSIRASTLWEQTYVSNDAGHRSWTQESQNDSFFFIDAAKLSVDDAIIDVGGGASRLVDELLARGYRDVTVLDVSPSGIAESRDRVRSDVVQWIVDDVTTWAPARTYQLWHDRAVFHFLVAPGDQERYVTTATRSLAPGGSLLLATFAPSGPTVCSGLAVQRWSVDELASRFAEGFTLLSSASRDHVTPWGFVQPFTWVLLRRDSLR